MTVNLNNVVFDNDLFTVNTDLGLLVLNKMDESLELNGFTTEIKHINIEFVLSDGTSIPCPSAIGLSNEYISLNTLYKEIEGEALTADNMNKCTIEVYEL